jgi:hypothetical protein
MRGCVPTYDLVQDAWNDYDVYYFSIVLINYPLFCFGNNYFTTYLYSNKEYTLLSGNRNNKYGEARGRRK